MKNSKVLEALVGGFVVLGILGFIFLAYKVSNVNHLGKEGSYTLYANFKSISGLKKGAAVTVAGVKIGQVDNIAVVKDKYEARVTISIDNEYDNLPLDSSISVLTQGLLGEKYLGIDAGGDVQYLAQGDEFDFVKSSVVLERLLDQFFLNNSSSSSN
ncbi:MAG: outer membrane lipid asymmetry maintenance protein MlaD [Ostreibacterium sp.]